MIAVAPMSRVANNSLIGARSAVDGKKNGDVTNGESSGDTSTFRRSDVTQQPSLNILNQVNNLSQLSATNTSFDPGLLVSSSSETHQHHAEGVITAFSGLVVQSSSCDNASAVATTTANGFNERRVSPPLHIPIQASMAAQSNHNPPTVSPPPSSVMMQQMPGVSNHIQSQQISYQNTSHHAHAQPMQQKPLQSGRVPATKHDNRKLFVGGLPNEVTDFTFLQFFQQYGEVVDSIVLLDRRTKRSRGFGFVTFADESVANALLNVIPGRTGQVNIFGKNCEIKASEPKTEESYHQQSHVQSHHNHTHQHQSSQWSDSFTPNRLVFSANGASIHPITNQSGGTSLQPPQNIHYPGMEQGAAMPLYSHSTITRITTGPIVSVDGTPKEGAANIYIQNNFYTLPPGTKLSPSHPLNSSPTMETLQMREEEFANSGGSVTYTHQHINLNPAGTRHASHTSLQPAYPGSGPENALGKSV